MSDRAFLDTNIFVYAFGPVEGAKTEAARRLIRDQIRSASGVISFQVVQEFFNVSLKRFATPMTVEDGKAFLMNVFRPLLSVQSSLALYGDALEIQSRYRISWYDSLIVAAARDAGCSILYTEDMQNGVTIHGVRIRNPFVSN